MPDKGEQIFLCMPKC